ncbi:MAG: MerR family transcriptional regulator [Tissierellia bacterium]|nr:MerR family transcriptional regulator [Tissierellia bacterium]
MKVLELDKQYSISEVAELTGYPPHVLRYYEKEFELQIPRNEANHRFYTYTEIETFQYIKSLQEKGFSNKQIKLILQSPEIIVNANEETALTSISPSANVNTLELAKEISLNLQEVFIDELHKILNNNADHNEKLISELMDEIIALRKELASKERDVLICENAKLKMKLKEKSYEVAGLREKLKRIENSKSLFQRLFKKQ